MNSVSESYNFFDPRVGHLDTYLVTLGKWRVVHKNGFTGVETDTGALVVPASRTLKEADARFICQARNAIKDFILLVENAVTEEDLEAEREENFSIRKDLEEEAEEWESRAEKASDERDRSAERYRNLKRKYKRLKKLFMTVTEISDETT